MSTVWKVILIILAVIIVILIALYFWGRKMMEKQQLSQSAIKAATQTMVIFVLDKKKMKATDSNLQQNIINSLPWYMKIRKLPLVSAKIGPQVYTLVADPKVYKVLPTKANVKVEIAGAFITKAISTTGGKAIIQNTKKKKKKK